VRVDFWKVSVKLISGENQGTISTAAIPRRIEGGASRIAQLPRFKQQSLCGHIQMPEAIPC
jgi:hypothetical protein